VIAQQGELVTAAILKKAAKLDLLEVPVVPFVSEEIQYLSADAEDRYTIAQATTPLNPKKEFIAPGRPAGMRPKFLFRNARPDRLHGRGRRAKSWASAPR
jgi:DNA-directed RNA polymerase subunit beta